MKYIELVELNERAHRIVNSDLDWEQKYDMIFSEDMSRKVHLDYYDPDTSYEEDVCAWVDAFDSYMETQKIIHEQIDI